MTKKRIATLEKVVAELTEKLRLEERANATLNKITIDQRAEIEKLKKRIKRKK